MAFFGLRKWPTPILRPLWPFMISGAFVTWGISNIQDKMVRSPEYATDPKNPYAPQIAKENAAH
ncbi:ATP synthase j chain-domain-containing protein [Mycena floridula]|nr:ATP synthase j chain-domain-containing protein [Mycena floridula]